MTESKEWVTIKVPATVRDRAREDERTYAEIMRAGLDETATTEDRLAERIDELHEQIPEQTAAEVEERLR